MKYRICNMRITGENKNYWLNQLQTFANTVCIGDIKCVDFGKQDIRGGFSICLIDNRNCIPVQELFMSKDAMLGFVAGYNMANNFNQYNRFKRMEAA